MSSPTEQLQISKKLKSFNESTESKEKQSIGGCFRGSDVFHRINFLAQVQHLVSSESPTSTNLHAFYGYTLQLLSRRTQSKLHSSLKSVLCKKCSTPLRPGTNPVRVRTRGKKGCKRLVVTCRICGTTKRFPNVERIDRITSKTRYNLKSSERAALMNEARQVAEVVQQIPPLTEDKQPISTCVS